MPEFSSFDQRGYPSVSARDGAIETSDSRAAARAWPS
jgi:hypothetical protein